MRAFWALPLRRQLVIAILLLILPVAGAMIWSGIVTYRDRVGELREESLVVASITAAWIDRDLLAVDRQAAVLARAAAVRTLDPGASAELLRQALAASPGTDDIVLADAAGAVVTRAAQDPPPADAAGDWATHVVTTGRRAVEPWPAIAGTPRMIVAHPVIDDEGRRVGALGQVLNLAPFQEAFAALPLALGSVVAIRDEDGRVIVHRADASHAGVVQPWVDVPVALQAPHERVGPDGVRRMYASALAAHGPWLVSAGVPISVAVGKTLSDWTRSFAVLGVVLAGWLVAAVVLSRRISGAARHLESAARRVAHGDYAAMEPRPALSQEFAELQGAFESMLQRLNETRQALDAQMTEERRIRRELETLQGQVIRQERLAAVGQLVSGVAHEINNPLQAILGFAELLQLEPDMPESARADLQIIQDESTRASGIIRSLAQFARQQPGEATPVRLAEIIQAVAELRRRPLGSAGIALVVDDRSTQWVRAVATELQQVLLNFVLNAEQAILGAGRLPGGIVIRTFDRGALVVLEVEDTGPGVPVEHESRLFEPFFTTKPVGQGTGLGLSVSYGILASLGGRIGYRRAGTGGAIFYFELPADEGPVAPANGTGSEP